MKIVEELIIKPLISEKSFNLVDNENQYTFLVSRKANKIEIKKAIEKMFKVEVKKVRIVCVRGKRVKFGKYRTEGLRKDYKKAIATLKTGDKIELFDLK